MIKQKDFNAYELEQFRHSQRLAYQCAEEVSGQLQLGMTEKQASKMMLDWMWNNGVREFLHQPFAWFGERSAFHKFRLPTQFLPTQKKLEINSPVILDLAPAVNGYVADIGYSLWFSGGSSVTSEQLIHEKLLDDLVEYRAVVVDGINAGLTFKQVYKNVDLLIRDQGYRRCHSQYPERVLAHRVAKVPQRITSKYHLFKFGVDALPWLVAPVVGSTLLPNKIPSPLWNDKKQSEHKAYKGLWAVEPHLAKGVIGAKWEEILVIDDQCAYWLDDNVPHLNRVLVENSKKIG